MEPWDAPGHATDRVRSRCDHSLCSRGAKDAGGRRLRAPTHGLPVRLSAPSRGVTTDGACPGAGAAGRSVPGSCQKAGGWMTEPAAAGVTPAGDLGTHTEPPPSLQRSGPRSRRAARLWSRARKAGPAYWLLAAMVAVGLAMRVVAITSWWPAITTVADSWPYAVYAETDPLGDPQHPAGYPAMLAVIGFLTRELAVSIIIQHLLGIVSALLLFAAVRRMTGSPWPALARAAVVLLNADQIFLEHTIMSEGPFVAVVAGAAYASVRAIDRPDPWWRWPAAAAALIVAAAVFPVRGALLLACSCARDPARRAAPVATPVARTSRHLGCRRHPPRRLWARQSRGQ